MRTLREKRKRWVECIAPGIARRSRNLAILLFAAVGSILVASGSFSAPTGKNASPEERSANSIGESDLGCLFESECDILRSAYSWAVLNDPAFRLILDHTEPLDFAARCVERWRFDEQGGASEVEREADEKWVRWWSEEEPEKHGPMPPRPRIVVPLEICQRRLAAFQESAAAAVRDFPKGGAESYALLAREPHSLRSCLNLKSGDGWVSSNEDWVEKWWNAPSTGAKRPEYLAMSRPFTFGKYAIVTLGSQATTKEGIEVLLVLEKRDRSGWTVSTKKMVDFTGRVY